MGALEAVQEAITTAFDNAGAFSAINGGLYFGRVDEGTSLPYARYADVSAAPPVLPFGTTVILPLAYQFDFWAVSRSDVVGYIEALILLFNRQSLTLSNGDCRMVVLQNTPPVSIEADKSKDGKDIYRGRVTFTFWANS